MTQDPVDPPDQPALAAIARPNGTFGMLALDQRETMRTMLAETWDGPVPDAALVRFKVDAARALTPAASAVLLDTAFALEAVEAEGARATGCGLIVGCDRFDQPPGGVVERTWFDASYAEAAARAGTAAIKLLVIWRRGEEVEQRARAVSDFLEAAARMGVVSIVEGIVRARSGAAPLAGEALDEAILDSARELCAFGPDLYKGEVPTLGAGTDERITAVAREMTVAVGPRTWVVLSAGVAAERFEDAVAAACRGGASGFLAGRGIWRPALPIAGREVAFRDVALPRLQRLGAIVDREARPYRDALGA
jgi:sulfofructosephosphate aldolase